MNLLLDSVSTGHCMLLVRLTFLSNKSATEYKWVESSTTISQPTLAGKSALPSGWETSKTRFAHFVDQPIVV